MFLPATSRFLSDSALTPFNFPPSVANPLPNRIGQRDMFALYSFVNQGVKPVGVRSFVGPQNKQFPAAGNDRRVALQGGIGQSAKGIPCFAEAASFHFDAKIDCIWIIANLNCLHEQVLEGEEEIEVVRGLDFGVQLALEDQPGSHGQ